MIVNSVMYERSKNMKATKIRKRLLSGVVTAAMVFGIASIPANATVASSGWEEGAVIEGNKIIAPADETEGIAGIVTREFQGDEIGDAKTYEVNVDLSSDYKQGELFCLSLGFGTDANTGNQEFIVMTQKDGDNFTITSSVDSGSYTLAPGIYTYQWRVEKAGGKNLAEFRVLQNDEVYFNSDGGVIDADLQNSTCVRYIWAFGRDVTGNSGYKLDRDLVMYKEVKTLDSISVVDGNDGVTPINAPKVGDKLTANIICTDGSTIGSYPVNENLSYEWSYEGSDTVLGTDPVYTVTEDNLGKTITVKVTGSNGYIGEVQWVAEDVVKEATTEPTEPSEPVDPSEPADTDKPEQTPAEDNTDVTTPDNEDSQDVDTPQTGDSTMLLGYIIMMLAAAGIAGVVVIGQRNENK